MDVLLLGLYLGLLAVATWLMLFYGKPLAIIYRDFISEFNSLWSRRAERSLSTAPETKIVLNLGLRITTKKVIYFLCKTILSVLVLPLRLLSLILFILHASLEFILKKQGFQDVGILNYLDLGSLDQVLDKVTGNRSRRSLSSKISVEKIIRIEINIPEIVYKNTSKNIQLTLRVTSRNNNVKPNSESLSIQNSYGEEKSIEVELLASGLEVDGPKIQKSYIYSNKMIYVWNCFFRHSGDQEIGMRIKAVSQDGTTIDLRCLTHSIRVVTLFGLTELQVYQLSIGLGIVGFSGTVLQVIKLLQEI